jgi:hypothetical protein
VPYAISLFVLSTACGLVSDSMPSLPPLNKFETVSSSWLPPPSDVVGRKLTSEKSENETSSLCRSRFTLHDKIQQWYQTTHHTELGPSKKKKKKKKKDHHREDPSMSERLSRHRSWFVVLVVTTSGVRSFSSIVGRSPLPGKLFQEADKKVEVNETARRGKQVKLKQVGRVLARILHLVECNGYCKTTVQLECSEQYCTKNSCERKEIVVIGLELESCSDWRRTRS